MVMNYELAKKLKDAGFPQGKITTSREGKGISYEDSGNEEGKERGIPFIEYDRIRDRSYIPTLSELIEACGDKFDNLERYEFYFTALGRNWPKNIEGIISRGSTPEEAVANLWLELNKK